ncbi:hypothetical protein [Streptomyces parvus]|uniref:Uncharacterized protein n=1 Tax=Streptomyces parvus TaxID=66428 RepID=A0A7K3S2V4_9ACTN|nr:hypothetical protein [Streptomyces parvus]NEC21836.1 hypothetical protein [Streptomyces parvus]
MLTAYLSSANRASPEPDSYTTDAKADLMERLLRHLEADWRPERTALNPTGGGEFHIAARPGAEITRLVVTCDGSGHIIVQRSADASPPRASVHHCGAKADKVTRIELTPTDSVTITLSNSTVQVLWGTRKVTTVEGQQPS